MNNVSLEHLKHTWKLVALKYNKGVMSYEDE